MKKFSRYLYLEDNPKLAACKANAHNFNQEVGDIRYYSVNTRDPNTIKVLLASGLPIQVTVANLQALRGGLHALILIGYDDAKNAFKTRNSWGASNELLWLSYKDARETDGNKPMIYNFQIVLTQPEHDGLCRQLDNYKGNITTALRDICN